MLFFMFLFSMLMLEEDFSSIFQNVSEIDNWHLISERPFISSFSVLFSTESEFNHKVQQHWNEIQCDLIQSQYVNVLLMQFVKSNNAKPFYLGLCGISRYIFILSSLHEPNALGWNVACHQRVYLYTVYYSVLCTEWHTFCSVWV